MATQKPINSFVFLDFETGGLDPRIHAATQIAMVAVRGDALTQIDTVSTYIQPYGEYIYDDEAMKHTGTTTNELQEGAKIGDCVNSIIELLKKADFTPKNKGSKPILVAYNSAFDKGFLMQIFEHTKKVKEFEKICYGHKDFYGNWQPEMMDAVHFTKATFGADPDIPNFKLGTCIEKAGIDLNNAHNALQDTLAMKEMCLQFFNKLRSTGTGDKTEAVAATRFRSHFQF